MKKSLSMLGAIVALALGGLFTAPNAQAQSVTCNPYSVSTRPTQWPAISSTTSYFYNCLSNTPSNNAKRDVVESQLYSLPAHIKSRLQANGVKFFLYESSADANVHAEFAGEFTGSYAEQTAGLSITGPVNPRSAILTQVNHGALFPIEVLSNAMLQAVTGHEAGHHMDYDWRNVPYPAADDLTLTQKFINLYAHDRFALNWIWNGVTTPTPRPACGSNSAFREMWDPSANDYICDGTNGQGPNLKSGLYSGLSNVQIAEFVYGKAYATQRFTTAIINGSLVFPNDSYEITITNANLPNGYVTVDHTVMPGESLQDVVDILVGKINSDTDLQNVGITALSQTGALEITAATAMPTYFTQTATILGSVSSGAITLKNPVGEYFAEKFATMFATSALYNTSDQPFTRFSAAFHKFVGSRFTCTQAMMSSLRVNSQEPAIYSASCVNQIPSGYTYP